MKCINCGKYLVDNYHSTACMFCYKNEAAYAELQLINEIINSDIQPIKGINNEEKYFKKDIAKVINNLKLKKFNYVKESLKILLIKYEIEVDEDIELIISQFIEKNYSMTINLNFLIEFANKIYKIKNQKIDN